LQQIKKKAKAEGKNKLLKNCHAKTKKAPAQFFFFLEKKRAIMTSTRETCERI
jgi:hypothetical protein